MLSKNEVITKADKLNIMASRSMPMPDGLNLAEQMLYQSLCCLYLQYKLNKITRDDATKTKKQIYSAYIDAAYDLSMNNTYSKILQAFQKKQDKIHNSGCSVCKELNDLLCGIRSSGEDESISRQKKT